ncbi:pectinesterase [Parapedobacter composti]|uniref:Pectinesterase n=1 Tax=Parapedobacter composti TaxID=623281 RepID=A0A1I1HVD0_9SPHI|nr:pectinesterase family protein [Parapedobacter composti]SFC28027.1 pectinesterase [Parapedobacter composti]
MSYWKCFYLVFLFIPLGLDAGVQTTEWVIAQDGTGDFRSVQEALMAVPDMRRQRTVIRIRPGVYREKLVLPSSKTNVSLIGEDAKATVLTYDDYADRKNRFGEAMGTSGSASFFVFGDGFYAENITFENSAGPVGQAVAVRVSADRVYFRNCRFLGHQDTLYPERAGSRQYYENCYIEGTTDFIFGAATAYFEACTIHSKSGGSYITAASTPDTARFGFVFRNCRLTADNDVKTAYLGRPWRPYAKTAFVWCELGGHIHPAGWHNWGREINEVTAEYVEHGNTGAGAAVTDRVRWMSRPDTGQADVYAAEHVLRGWVPVAVHRGEK